MTAEPQTDEFVDVTTMRDKRHIVLRQGDGARFVETPVMALAAGELVSLPDSSGTWTLRAVRGDRYTFGRAGHTDVEMVLDPDQSLFVQEIEAGEFRHGIHSVKAYWSGGRLITAAGEPIDTWCHYVANLPGEVGEMDPAATAILARIYDVPLSVITSQPLGAILAGREHDAAERYVPHRRDREFWTFLLLLLTGAGIFLGIAIFAIYWITGGFVTHVS